MLYTPFMYKRVVVESTTYPKFKVLTLILLKKMKYVQFSYDFGYYYSPRAALVLMLMNIISYNINHS